MSLATFKLNKVEIIQQSVGYSSSIKLQVGDITCEDCGSISWEEFQVFTILYDFKRLQERKDSSVH